MDLIVTKVIVALLFGLIRFLFGILPIYVNTWLHSKRSKKEGEIISERKRQVLEYAVAVIQSFGGGVLFATSFLHMMPEVFVSVKELRKFGILDADYPYSQLIISLGFFAVYFVEEFSQWLIARTPEKPFKKRNKNKRVSSTTTMISTDSKATPEFTKIPSGMAFEIQQRNEKNANYEHYDINVQYIINNNVDAEVIVDSVDQEVQTEGDENYESVKSPDSVLNVDPETNAEIEEFIEEEVKTQQQIVRCFLMVMALSLHALFEGLAIGLQRSVTNIWYLFIAVSIHSATILFCTGMEIVLAGSSVRSTIIHMSMLSGTSPFGVILGLVITLTTNLETSAKSFAIVLLEGLSAGTILYITFFEILSREKARKKCRLARGISIAFGFTLMALLQALKIDS